MTTPDRDRQAEIAALPLGQFTICGRDPQPFVWLTVEQREWLLAELARITAERDGLREANVLLANEIVSLNARLVFFKGAAAPDRRERDLPGVVDGMLFYSPGGFAGKGHP